MGEALMARSNLSGGLCALVSPLATLALTVAVAASVGADDTKTAASNPWRVSPRKTRMKNPVPPDAASIAIGAELYSQECLSCHGDTGKGDGPEARKLETAVPDMTGPEMWDQTDGELFWKITLGRRPMPGMRKLLAKEERWHLVNYSRTLAPRPVPASPAESPAGTAR